MKKYFIVFATLIFLLGSSCEEKINIEKEKEAIKAVFEADKTAYFNPPSRKASADARLGLIPRCLHRFLSPELALGFIPFDSGL